MKYYDSDKVMFPPAFVADMAGHGEVRAQAHCIACQALLPQGTPAFILCRVYRVENGNGGVNVTNRRYVCRYCAMERLTKHIQWAKSLMGSFMVEDRLRY